MKIKTKLIIPPIIAITFVSVFLHFLLEPQLVDEAKQLYIQKTHEILKASESDIVRGLIENNTAILYSALDYKKELYENQWFNLKYIDKNNNLGYPLFFTDEIPHKHEQLIYIKHELTLSGTKLGHLELILDWSSKQEQLHEKLHVYDTIFVIAMLLMLAISYLTQIKFIFKPIEKLKNKIYKVSQGDFETGQYKNNGDELGELFNKFFDMQEKIKTSHEEIMHSRKLAESSNVAKSQFLANMSHEIRTPMNGVLGLTQLALDTDLNDEQREYIEKAHISAELLLGIINDILDFSKIDAGKLELESVNFNISKVIQNITNLTQLKAQESGVLLSVQQDKSLPEFIQGDPLRFSQILINLTNNAIKFTKSGGKVSVNIGAQEITRSCITLRCSVEDTGIGMTKEEQQKLFKAFSQTNSSVSRKHGGTGLGLAISSQLVQLMHGEIWVESEKNKGSTFYFTIKLKPSNATEQQDTIDSRDSISQTKLQLENIKILLVEDNKINQLIAKKLLLANKIDVVIANDGQEAIERLEEQTFDGVLMDCQMPVMDGYEATRQIREKEKFKDLPILAMTANAMKQDIEKALDCGMNDHIAKPVNPDTMFQTMSKWIKP